MVLAEQCLERAAGLMPQAEYVHEHLAIVRRQKRLQKNAHTFEIKSFDDYLKKTKICKENDTDDKLCSGKWKAEQGVVNESQVVQNNKQQGKVMNGRAKGTTRVNPRKSSASEQSQHSTGTRDSNSSNKNREAKPRKPDKLKLADAATTYQKSAAKITKHEKAVKHAGERTVSRSR